MSRDKLLKRVLDDVERTKSKFQSLYVFKYRKRINFGTSDDYFKKLNQLWRENKDANYKYYSDMEILHDKINNVITNKELVRKWNDYILSWKSLISVLRYLIYCIHDAGYFEDRLVDVRIKELDYSLNKTKIHSIIEEIELTDNIYVTDWLSKEMNKKLIYTDYSFVFMLNHPDEKYPLISFMFTKPEFRRCGHALDLIAGIDFKYDFKAFVDRSNIAVIKLFKKRGIKKIGSSPLGFTFTNDRHYKGVCHDETLRSISYD